jgi:hypothetical protein
MGGSGRGKERAVCRRRALLGKRRRQQAYPLLVRLLGLLCPEYAWLLPFLQRTRRRPCPCVAARRRSPTPRLHPPWSASRATRIRLGLAARPREPTAFEVAATIYGITYLQFSPSAEDAGDGGPTSRCPRRAHPTGGLFRRLRPPRRRTLPS